jgi:hypothetical protein
MPRAAASKTTKGKRRGSGHYSRWSKGEIRELRQLARAKMPMRDIGRQLGRTAISIRGKAQREGISLALGAHAAYGRRSRGNR